MNKRKLLIGLVATGAFGAGFGALPATAQLRIFSVTLLSGQTVTVQVDAPADKPASEIDLPVTGKISTVTEVTTTNGSTAEITPTTPQETPTSTAKAPTSSSTAPSTSSTAPATTATSDLPTTATGPAPSDNGATTDTGSTTGDAGQASPAEPTLPTVPTGAEPPISMTPGTETDDQSPIVGDDGTPELKRDGQRKQKITGEQRRKKDQEDLEEPGRLHGTPAQQEEEVASGRIRNSGGAPTVNNPTFTEALPGSAPIGVPNFFIDKFRIPPFLLPIYQAAGTEYGVRWEILAAINEIETDYGRNLNVSSAGALGWMQFMPATWKSYGVDANRDGKKDPYNPVDAIFAAARYLKAAGADTDVRKAIFAYNHADWYVDSVLMRARLIGGMPSDLIGSLTGLTQGRFPVDGRAVYADDLSEKEYERRIARGNNAAIPVEGDSDRRSIGVYAKAGTPVIATQDATVVKIGSSQRLGRYVKIRDVYGNVYTYGNLGKVAEGYGTAKQTVVSAASVRKELKLPKDPEPTEAASAGTQDQSSSSSDAPASEQTKERESAAQATTVAVSKLRVFANPARPRSYANGGKQQLLDRGTDSASEDAAAATAPPETLAAYAQVLGLKPSQIVVKRMRVGAKVVAGTVLGEIGEPAAGVAPHVTFEIRPAGEGAPRIDPKPLLDGWKLLESTAIYRAAGKNPFFGPNARNPTIGQILLMSKESLQRAVLTNPQIKIYECGREDIRGGVIDRRVLATMEFLAASGLRPTISSLHCGHGFYTASGNVSEHSAGSAMDIAAVNGIPIIGHQGAGSITDMTIRRLLTLQGTMKPHQIISLMTFDGADNTLSLPDHADHIHVGFRPEYDPTTKQGQKAQQVLKPNQWIKLISQINKIDNPTVLTSPSKYAVDAKSHLRTGTD